MSTSASARGRARNRRKGKFTKQVDSADVIAAKHLEERANARPLSGIAEYMQAAREFEEKK